MNLTEKPDAINFLTTHYVFVEKIGPFKKTAQKAWKTLHQNTAAILEVVMITGYSVFIKLNWKSFSYC
ncbi:MAG: hypothetical protein H7336_14300 [Bacteriovorax sp.]|nr:hypothetical protein [Bacteriovorax sp.]